jgi:Asp-tRNA(Asn)/Glu-tRNA(Gln) amidotransferase B subunit
MPQGSLRCDVNVSINRPGHRPGSRCEIKNLNSIKFIQIAISACDLFYLLHTRLKIPTASEIHRQIALCERGEMVQQETRGFDEERSDTFKLRSKEDAPDYRYMPDPNLPPLLLTEVLPSVSCCISTFLTWMSFYRSTSLVSVIQCLNCLPQQGLGYKQLASQPATSMS